jgi:hypothetical protein
VLLQFLSRMAPRAESAFASIAACLLCTGVLAAAPPMAAPLGADPTTVGPIIISVPAGFQHAQTQRQKKHLVTAWTKSVHDGSMKTLLQIDVVDFGAAPSANAEKYLRQFLGNIERRRSHYISSPLAHIQLAGLPAVRASWNGSIGDHAAVGVMYSVIVQNRFAVILHTQDLGNMPTSGMLEAMRAIETVGRSDPTLSVISPPHHP